MMKKMAKANGEDKQVQEIQAVDVEYTEVEASRDTDVLAVEIKALTAQAQQMVMAYVCAIGQRLAEAKAAIGHGGWGRWLEEKVNYSQSTAENYIKIYNEYGDRQISLLGEPDSQPFQNLEYTKLLALTVIPAEERAAFAVENDAEHISVRELKERIEQEKREKQSVMEELEEARREREDEIQLKEELIAQLREKLEEMEAAPAIDPEVAEQQKAEFEEKLHKAEQAKAQAEAKREELEQKLKDKESEVEQRAAEAAEQIAAEKTKGIAVEKEEAVRRAAELEKKLQAAEKQELAAVNFYFAEAQEYLRKLSGAMAELTASAAETAAELLPKMQEVLVALVNEL